MHEHRRYHEEQEAHAIVYTNNCVPPGRGGECIELKPGVQAPASIRFFVEHIEQHNREEAPTGVLRVTACVRAL